MKGKNTLAKILPVLLILVAFFFVSEQFKEKERTSFAVDREEFVVVDTEEQLKARLATESQDIDPEMLELVEKHNLMTTIDSVNIPVVEEQREFRIESLFNQGLRLFITYSLEVLPNDKDPDAIPHFQFDRLKVTADGQDPLEISMREGHDYQNYHYRNDGIVYKNRIYRRVIVQEDWNEDTMRTLASWVKGSQAENFDHIDQAIMKISKIELQDVELVKKRKNGEEKFALDDISIDYNMKSWNPLLDTRTINKTVQLGNGNSITYTEFENRLQQRRLYFEMETPHDFAEIHYEVGTMDSYSHLQKDAEGRQYIDIHRFPRSESEESTISLVAATYPTEEEIEFLITEKEFMAFRTVLQENKDSHDINRDVGSINGINFKLVRLERNNNGPNQHNYGFFLNMDNDRRHGPNIHFQNYQRFLETIKDHPEAEVYMKSQPFIDVQDQDGTRIRSDHYYSDDTGQFFGLDNHDFEKIKELKVRLFNLPMEVKFSENEVLLKSE